MKEKNQLINQYTKNFAEYTNCIKEMQNLYSAYFTKALECNDLIENTQKTKLKFGIKQFFNAISPENSLFNPKVIEEFVKTEGKSLYKGYCNFLRDCAKGEIQTDAPEFFKLGENIATTSGDVVFRNELMELIYYTPKTKTVYEVPMLIIPPWINKYYILDLQENNSFINWLVENGFSVFVISWVNPGKQHAETTFEDYLLKGAKTACEKTMEISGAKNLNLLGYCIGGTLLTTLLAYLAKQNANFVSSATFLATLIDFTDPGEIGMFIDDFQIKIIEEQMRLQGFFSGEQMRKTFSLLKSEDMVWRYFVNNYLLGKDNKPMDILHWNADSTNLPYKMHQFYLREFYQKNSLVKKDELEFDGVAIDISKINVNSYFVATLGDHIAPWKAVFKGAHYLSGSKQFTLASSGHVAGIINHPKRNKYNFATGKITNTTAEEWQENKRLQDGSWWVNWLGWLIGNSGKKITPFKIQEEKIIERAPGTYVKQRIN